MNLFLDNRSENETLRQRNPKYRDEQTEGYNIVPNFFISAKMDEGLSYADNISTSNLKENTFISRHFSNRLFDRDTLLVYHYDVNFLYVVSLYARENTYQKAQWKQKVRKLFREKIQEALQEKYEFYAMTPKPGVIHEEYLRHHFQELLGKVYRPYDDPQFLSLALDNQDADTNEALLSKLRKDYYVVMCPLGENPKMVLEQANFARETTTPHGRQGVLMVMMMDFDKRSNNFLSSGQIAIGIKATLMGMEIVRHIDNIGYILFHNRRDDGQHLFGVKATPKVISKVTLTQNTQIYPNASTSEIYLLVAFDHEHVLNNTSIHTSNIKVHTKERYDPSFIWLEELKGQ